MKATALSARGKVPPESPAVVSLPVTVWEEESFGLPLSELPEIQRRWELLDWEDVEAIGAADDPARFRIDVCDVQPADASGPRLEHPC